MSTSCIKTEQERVNNFECVSEVPVCKNVTFHRRHQGDVHIAQMSKAALHHQLRSRRLSAAQNLLFFRNNASLLEDRLPAQK